LARHRFKTVPALLAALERAGAGDRAMSPGGVANKLGLSRQTVYDRIERGIHNTWQCGSIVLVDPVPTRPVAYRRRKD